MCSTIDVLPHGVMPNCNKMKFEEVETMIKTASPTHKLNGVGFVEKADKDNEPKTQRQDVCISIRKHADNKASTCSWSLQISYPMIKVPIKGHPCFITVVAPQHLVSKVAAVWGGNTTRNDTQGSHNVCHMDEGGTKGAKKNVHLFCYGEPPKIDIPPFFSLQDKHGQVIGTWPLETRCFDTDRFNVCNKCRCDMS